MVCNSVHTYVPGFCQGCQSSGCKEPTILNHCPFRDLQCKTYLWPPVNHISQYHMTSSQPDEQSWSAFQSSNPIGQFIMHIYIRNVPLPYLMTSSQSDKFVKCTCMFSDSVGHMLHDWPLIYTVIWIYMRHKLFKRKKGVYRSTSSGLFGPWTPGGE